MSSRRGIRVQASRQVCLHPYGAIAHGLPGGRLVDNKSQQFHRCILLCRLLASMRSGKTDGVHQKTLNRLGRFIEEFRQLNFANDTEMEARLESVRRELLSTSAEDYRQSPRATRNLQEGLSDLRDHARNLAQQDTRELVERFGQMGRRKLQLVS